MRETVGSARDFYLTIHPPSIIQCDNEGEFGRELDYLQPEFPGQCRIIHDRPRHSQTQGSVEGGNRLLVERLSRKLMSPERSREKSHEYLSEVVFNINNTFSRVT